MNEIKSHKITMVDAGSLNPAPYNPRKIAKVMLEALKTSLRTHGWVENLIVQREGMIVIGGHQRLRAYLEINQEKGTKPGKVPCIILDVNERTAKKLNVALNRVVGEFDSRKLGELLLELDNESRLLDDEVRNMGFTVDEKQRFIDVASPPDIEPDGSDITEFAKSVTLSIEFDSVDQRDRAKRLLIERAKIENKKSGSILLELLR